MKKLLLTQVVLILAFFFSPVITSAQAGVNSNIAGKSVVYKIKKGEQNEITSQKAIDIDKLLVSKKGIISSLTNSSTRLVSVKMETNFPEEEIKKLLGNIFKLEVESYQVTDNSK